MSTTPSAPRTASSPVSAISVSKAAAHVRGLVDSAFDGKPVWVRGVLDDMSRKSASGHKYFALIEYGDEGRSEVVARLNAVMWQSNRQRVNDRLRKAGMSEAIKDGTVVSMLGTFRTWRT